MHWLAQQAGVARITRPEYVEPQYEFGDSQLPKPTSNPPYVFHPFPEMIRLPDGTEVVVQDQAEKDAVLAPAADNVMPIRRLGRPRKAV